MKTVKSLTYLVIYGSYQELAVGLFEGPRLICSVYRDNIRLSAHLLGALDEVFGKGGVRLTDLSCIAVCQGPGSFSSLRALLASVNGIALASDVPLIGCDGLLAVSDLLAVAVPLGQPYMTLAVMNAYNNEFFYVIEQVNAKGKRSCVVPAGYAVAENILMSVVEGGLPVLVAGNSASKFTATSPVSVLQEVGYTPIELLQALAAQARQRWVAGEMASSLQPSHLKALQFKKLDCNNS